MENFEVERCLYLDELRNMLLSEGLVFNDYLIELGEENENIVRKPSNMEELNTAKKALEIFTKLRTVSNTENFDPENNSAYTIGYLIVKGLSDNLNMLYAAELDNYMQSSEYLKGKFIVDKLLMPKNALKSIVEKEIKQTGMNPQEFALGLLSSASFVSNYYASNKKSDSKELSGNKKGIALYVNSKECVLTYLNERDTNLKDNDHIRKYKFEKGI